MGLVTEIIIRSGPHHRGSARGDPAAVVADFRLVWRSRPFYALAIFLAPPKKLRARKGVGYARLILGLHEGRKRGRSTSHPAWTVPQSATGYWLSLHKLSAGLSDYLSVAPC